jgi:hypothetical protein
MPVPPLTTYEPFKIVSESQLPNAAVPIPAPCKPPSRVAALPEIVTFDNCEHSSAARVKTVERSKDELSNETETVLERIERGATADIETPETIKSKWAFEIEILLTVERPLTRKGIAKEKFPF